MEKPYVTASTETVQPGDYLIQEGGRDFWVSPVDTVKPDGIGSPSGWHGGLDRVIVIKGPKSDNPGGVVLGKGIIEDIERIEEIVAKEETKTK